MLFDYFFLLSADPAESYHRSLDRLTEQAVLAEKLGFEAVWASEHHFGGEGFDIAPNPILTLMHLARYTDRIRLGIGAAILPEWHPLRLAEDVAVLDHSTRGRVEFGVGKGITNRELSNLSTFDVDRRNKEANEAIFQESLEIIRKAWTQDPFTHRGTYYTFPKLGVIDSYARWYPDDRRYRDANGEYIGMSIVPKPYQKPHPPLWVVGDSEATFTGAALLGLKPITWLRSHAALKRCFELFRDESSRIQGRAFALGEDAALMRVCFVAPSAQQARDLAEPGVNTMYRDYLGGLRGRDIYAEPGETIGETDLAKPWYEFLEERGHLLIGTPDDVGEQIAAIRDDIGLQRMLVFTWLPGMQHEEATASLRLFGEKVVPKFAGQWRSGRRLKGGKERRWT